MCCWAYSGCLPATPEEKTAKGRREWSKKRRGKVEVQPFMIGEGV